MSRFLQRDLEWLNSELMRMAALADQAVHKALQALRDRDAGLAREVILGDAAVDVEENLLTDECLKMLALHQPVARDLRQVTTAMMIATDLERIADLAQNIAERAVHLAELPTSIAVPVAMPAMAEKAKAMIQAGLEAFATLDVKKARAVCRADHEVDRLSDEAIRELVAAMKTSQEAVPAGLSMFSVVRHLERLADHATNIAEDVVYLAEGAIIRHHPEWLADE